MCFAVWATAKLCCADRPPGRRIVSLQTSQALLNAPQADTWSKNVTDAHGRIPFTHPALAGLSGLTGEAQDQVLDKSRLAGLAERYGFDKVTLWKPKRVWKPFPLPPPPVPLLSRLGG